MKNKILNALKPFRVPLIILGVFLIALLVMGVILPGVQSSVAGTSPVVSIEAENDTVYQSGTELSAEDFTVTATHENGGTSTLGSDEYELSTTSLSPVGETTTLTITYLEDESITCSVDVSVEREKVVGFQVGYPEVTNVTAVLYSNGELCFEGEGDVLICNQGEYPWFDYDGIDDYPITAVSFEDGVTPTDMNYWFEGIETLTYVDSIPSSVQTMVRTFANCTALTQAADWSACTSLLNINEVYSGCTALTGTEPLVESIRTAYRAYAECTNLLSCPDSSNASSLYDATEMYAQCTNLVDAEVGPAVEDMTYMFSDCINLINMPEIPDGVEDMTYAFANCVKLSADGGTLTAIPSSVEVLTGCFSECELLQGTLTINSEASEYDGIFSNACLATQLNLVGSSNLLDLYANSYDGTGQIFVNGYSPDSSVTEITDVYPDYADEESNYSESSSTSRDVYSGNETSLEDEYTEEELE